MGGQAPKPGYAEPPAGVPASCRVSSEEPPLAEGEKVHVRDDSQAKF